MLDIQKTMLGGLTLLFSLALAACSSGSGDGPGDTGGANPTSKNTPKEQLSAERFASCQDFRNYYANSLAQEIFTGYSFHRGCFGCEPLMQGQPFAETATDSPPATAPTTSERTVTDTNTQEAGVDEADLIETHPSGTLLYVLRQHARELLVIDTTEIGNPQILRRLSLSDRRQPRGLFLDAANDRLVVILEQGFVTFLAAPAVTDAAFAPPPRFEQGTEVQFYDVREPASPVLLKRYISDGHYVDARRIDERLHLITQFGFPYPQQLNQDESFRRLAYEDYPRARRNEDEAEIQRLEAEIRSRIQAAVDATPAAELLPEETTDSSGTQTLACESIAAPAVATRMGLLMITSLDTDGGDRVTLGSINNAWQVYASRDNIYLIQTSGGWWFDPDQRQQTAIYRFDISSGAAEPGALGLVDGWIHNRFSLGEHAGHLRVATTEGRFANGDRPFTQHNHLTVLRTSDLDETGTLRDFVPEDIDPDRGETIRSARFLGDRGFVVTFLFTDPLFAFDLSDPNDPVLAGQLEIPGFSSYIHPLGADHLLTIGREGGEDGQGTGPAFQLQVFDVSDLATPRQVATASPTLQPGDYAFSLAEYEPLAFTFLPTQAEGAPPAGLLSIPAQIGSGDPQRALSGFVAYRIDVAQGGSAIREYAQIDHKGQPNANDGGSHCPPRERGDEQPPGGCTSFAPVIYNEPLRSAIIREGETLTLLTVSSAKLQSLDASGEVPVDLGTLRFDTGASE